jgi:hypothetical protein
VIEVFYDYICNIQYVAACITSCGGQYRCVLAFAVDRWEQIQTAAVTVAKIVAPTRSRHVRTYSSQLADQSFLSGHAVADDDSNTCMRLRAHRTGIFSFAAV